MRMNVLTAALASCILAPALAGAVEARPSLRDVAAIESGLFSIAVADKIRRECPDISGRLFRAHGQMRELYSHALELGYSKAEIEAYVAKDSEKARMRARRDKYLASQGVVKSDPATYCAAGRAEISKSSQIGALLKAR